MINNKTDIENIEVGDRVIYVPSHANGDVNHPDCEYGIVKSWNDSFVFVNYVTNGIPQLTAQATRPEDLYLDGKADLLINVLDIFNKLNK